MILWILLFLLVLVISFVLAAKSMRDYQEIPTPEENGLFLVRKTSTLNREFLESINEELLQGKRVLSFERLIKGDKSALVLFGPKNLYTIYKDSLDLLELEDYTNVNMEQISAWEVGIKKFAQPKFPVLYKEEQLWWQLVLSAKKEKTFHFQIRAVVVCENEPRRKELTDTLLSLAAEEFFKLPKAFSSEQIVDFYRKRVWQKNENPSLNPAAILQLLKL